MKNLRKIFLLPFLILAWPGSWQAAQATSAFPVRAPGEVVRSAGNLQIFLEHGRSLIWPSRGPLTLQGPDGAPLAQVDLQAQAEKTTGAEALGIEVEEADLGGSLGSKKYLKGEKTPKGRRLDASALQGSTPEKERGQTTEQVVQGVTIRTTQFPNGSALLTLLWPDLTEEAYFDRRKTLVSNQQTRKIGVLSFTLKQWGDGSFSRIYRQDQGEVRYTYDAIAQGYNIEFLNSRGEMVEEFFCDGTCS